MPKELTRTLKLVPMEDLKIYLSVALTAVETDDPRFLALCNMFAGEIEEAALCEHEFEVDAFADHELFDREIPF